MNTAINRARKLNNRIKLQRAIQHASYERGTAERDANGMTAYYHVQMASFITAVKALHVSRDELAKITLNALAGV